MAIDPQLQMERNILFDQIDPIERALDTASRNDTKAHKHLTIILKELKALKADVDAGEDYLERGTEADRAKKVSGTLNKSTTATAGGPLQGPVDPKALEQKPNPTEESPDPDHPNGGHGGILPEGMVGGGKDKTVDAPLESRPGKTSQPNTK